MFWLYVRFFYEQLKGFTKSKASEEQIEERFKVCGPCPFFVPSAKNRGTCTACQCNLSLKRSRMNKLALKTSKCPKGAWNEVH